MSIRSVQFTAGGQWKRYLRVAGIASIANLGWYQFTWGHNRGKAQQINFEQAILFPEAQGATGCLIWCPSDVTWAALPVTEPTGGFSASNANGLINLALGALAGYPSALAGPAGNGPGGSPQTLSLPYNNPGTGMQQTSTYGAAVAQEYTSDKCDWAFWGAALGFASEIAQQCAYYNQAENVITFGPYTMYALAAPITGVPRSATIIVSAYPAVSSSNFGSTGMPMLGAYAWDYNGYCGKLQYINATNVWTVPEFPNCTGINLWLKPGVHATVNMGVNDFMTTSTIASLGEINFFANKLAGIKPKSN